MRAIALAVLATTAACNLFVSFDQPAESGAQCHDMVDNDGNGQTDCDEPTCTPECGSVCGDAHVSGPEECDDGNDIAGDGCEPTCLFTCGSGLAGDGRSFDPTTGHCYIGLATPQDVIGANENCMAIGGYLAVPDDAVEDGLIRAAAVGAAALGLADSDTDGFYSFRQVTGDQGAEYLNFSSGQPDEPHTNNICVSYDGGASTWQDNDCVTPRPYVCELEPDPCGDFVRQSGEECDDGNDFEQDGCTSECRDVDECALGTDNCSVNADCFNEPWQVARPAGFTCQCQTGFVGDGVTCTPLPAQPVFVEGEPTPVTGSLIDCTSSSSFRGRKIAVDPYGGLYVVMLCSGDARVAASVDGGITWTGPQFLRTAVEEVAVVGVSAGRAVVATQGSNGEVQVHQTRDFGATWGFPGTVTFQPSATSGLGLASDGDAVVVGVIDSTGLMHVHRSQDADLQSFTSAATINAREGDVLIDPTSPSQVWAVGTNPTYQLMNSTNGGVDFPPNPTTPLGSQMLSDWAANAGIIAVVGTADFISIMSTTNPGTTTDVSGLPVAINGERTLAIDASGAVIVAQTTATGGVQLVRLGSGAGAFDGPVGVDFVGTHPGITLVPNGLAAVVYSGGMMVHVAIINPVPPL